MLRLPAFSTRQRGFLSILVLIAGAAWTGLSAAEPGALHSGKVPAPQAGFLAPDFHLSTAGGDTLALSDLRGNPLIVNFWASWCRPCRQEMPALQRVYIDYRAQGLVVLGVNATSQDSQAAALAFAREMGLSFPILLDQDGQAANLYQLRAFPTTFFVDDQGIIQEVIVGGPMAEALLRIRVEQLLEGNPSLAPEDQPGGYAVVHGWRERLGRPSLWEMR